MNFGFVTAWISVAGTANYPMVSVAMASCWWYVLSLLYFPVLIIPLASWTMLYGSA
jgi:hypothetical protein